MSDRKRSQGLGANCKTPAEHAESATLHALLNCYHRETGNGRIISGAEAPVSVHSTESILYVPFTQQEVAVYAALRYDSETGRHIFDLPIHVRQKGQTSTVDAGTLAAFIRREIMLSTGADTTEATDLLRRILVSQREIERFIRERSDNAAHLEKLPTFIRAEQSLCYGHHLHPTPKSREGIAEHEVAEYAPELRGSFQLDYFAADAEIVSQWSAHDESATQWISSGLREANSMIPQRAESALNDGKLLIPVHPWQADALRSRQYVADVIDTGHLIDLGEFGPTFYPTSSVRTLWSPETPYMVKSSVAIEITNAERTIPRSKLRLAVAAAELLTTEYADRLSDAHPQFSILADAAAATIDVGSGSESGFEMILRENPFRGISTENTATVVALCQDRPSEPPWVSQIIQRIAQREGRPASKVAREWFRQYLRTVIHPVVWSYFKLGVGLEAHQQNTVVRLDEDGWPKEGFYRDNGGYCFPRSRYDLVDSWIPGLENRVETVCSDEIIDRCLRYYLFINNAFGVINALGVGRAADETTLLKVLREEIASLVEIEPATSDLLSVLLDSDQIPCKGNLFTRFEGYDELDSTLDDESVYVEIANPLTTPFRPS